MKTSHRIALRLSEIRQQLNEWPEDGKAEELDTLTTEYRQQEAEYRAALVTEDSESGSIRNNQDGESAEMRRLRKDASLSNYMLASMARRGVTGAEAELNQALGIIETDFPLDLIAPEVRAAIDGDSETNQGSWVDAVFHETAAMRLGITFPSVEAGIASLSCNHGWPVWGAAAPGWCPGSGNSDRRYQGTEADQARHPRELSGGRRCKRLPDWPMASSVT